MRGRPQSCSERNLSESLLLAAETRLRDKSHLDLTCREIAEAAGTHAGMVNYYFQGKDGLLLALFKKIADMVDRVFDVLEIKIETSDQDPTENIVRGLIDAYYPNAAVTSIFVMELLRADTLMRDFYARGREYNSVRIENLVRKIITKGIYRYDLDPVAASWMLFSLIIGPLTAMRKWPKPEGGSIGPMPPDVWIENIVRLLRNDFLAEAAKR